MTGGWTCHGEIRYVVGGVGRPGFVTVSDSGLINVVSLQRQQFCCPSGFISH